LKDSELNESFGNFSVQRINVDTLVEKLIKNRPQELLISKKPPKMAQKGPCPGAIWGVRHC